MNPSPHILNPSTTLIFLSAYFVLVLLAPRLLSRRIADLKDFFLAGRQLSALPVAMTFVAAWFGAASTMGTINAVHDGGVNGLWFVALPSFGSFIVISLFFAKRVARQTAMSMPEAVEAHYGRAGRFLMTLVILASTNAFIASQMVAAGQVFGGVLGLDVVWATVLSTAVVVAYSAVGGYFAVVVTDFLKLSLVIAALCTLAFFTVTSVGDVPHFLATRPEGFFNFASGDLLKNITLALCFVIGWSIAPEMWQRMSSTKDEHSALRASWLASVILMSLFALIATIGVFSSGIITGDRKAVMVDLALRLPHPMLSLFVLIGFISAVSSTMDSGINVSSLTMTNDVYKGFIRPHASNRELLWVGRLSTFFVVIPAVLVALKFQDIIHVLWIAADIYASTMFFPVVGMLYLRQPGKYAGVLAMIFGGVMATFSALVQYGVVTPGFFWPPAPYSTLLGIAASGIGFAVGYWLSRREPVSALPLEVA